MEASIRHLGYGQILFVVLLSVMALVRPDVYFGNDGVSRYALLLPTEALFVVAFLTAAISMWFAAKSLQPRATLGNLVRAALRLSAVLTLGLVVFPAIGNGLVDHIHIGCAVTLFVLECLLVMWLTARAGWNVANLTLLTILITAALVSLLALCCVLHCKTQAEVAFQLAFNLLLLRLLRVNSVALRP